MKTTDGHEVKVGGWYYLESGQVVILNDCAVTPKGKEVFLVTPYYEGEAMSVSCDGGYHHEMSMDYEHEGDETLVYALFKEVPLERLSPEYEKKLQEIEALALAAGTLKIEVKALNSETQKSKKLCEEEEKLLLELKLLIKGESSMLYDVKEKLQESRQKLSEFEDSIPSRPQPGVDGRWIDTVELQRLSKRDFELYCLEAGGIDNWEWYGESLKDYRKRYPEG